MGVLRRYSPGAIPEPRTVSGRSTSIKDVAQRAGVSTGTVSNVLNRPERVNPRNRLRVEQAMAELNFVRNESARQLRAGRSRTVCYVLLDATNPFFTDVAQGMESVAEDRGLSLFLCNSDNSTEREITHLSRLYEQRVQGILITPLDPDASHLAELATRGTPVVIVDRTRRDGAFCSVSVNDLLGGRVAIEHLVDRGHRRVAFIGGPSSLGQVHERWLGARLAWGNAGLPDEDLLMLPTAGLRVLEGRDAGKRLLAMPTRERPTAVLCGNDLVALGLLQQATSLGVNVPRELAIIGYDDIDFAAAAAVPLTSVRQPRRALGSAAGRLLLDEADNPGHIHEQLTFEPDLIVRGST